MAARRSASSKSVIGTPGPATRKITHLSYSTLNTYFECPKKVQLAKQQLAPASTAWWFAGGSAVHAASDAYDHWSLLDPVTRPRFQLRQEWDEAFDKEVDDIAKRHPDKSKWRNAGSKDAPETYDRWKDTLGPELVAAYVRWRQRSPWTIWHTPAGDPAIEIDLSTTFPGCDMEVKAYADRIFTNPMMDEQIVVDFKSGTRKPESPLQFGVYSAGMTQLHDTPCRWGYPFMNRKAQLASAMDLSKYTPEYIGKLFGHLSKSVAGQVWPAHQTHNCRMCDVAEACYINGGARSKEFDPDDPRYVGATPF